MNMKWSVLTLVGADQPGIVAAVTDALYKQGCSLGQASMMKLGGNFSIMLRVSHSAETDLRQALSDPCSALNLHLHLDEDISADASAIEPDVQITVYGADRSGIVAQVSSLLADAGLNIIDLETDIGGSQEHPIYIMTMDGVASKGVQPLQDALESLGSDIEINIDEINTLRA